jgi:hypothetical protein
MAFRDWLNPQAAIVEDIAPPFNPITATTATTATTAGIESSKQLAANDQETQKESDADWYELIHGESTEELLYKHLLACPLCHITFEQYCYEGAKLGKAYDALLLRQEDAKLRRESLALRVDRACIKALPKIPF